MIIAIDVYYKNGRAKSVAIEFEDWTDEEPTQIHTVELDGIAGYVPGEFYKRELPCILKVLKKSDLSKVEAIVVDSYVQLDDDGKLGLGGYLYHHLEEKIPVIGVAKKKFHTLNKLGIPILRGESQKPLFITAIGIDLAIAAEKVQGMFGEYRFPELLKILDQETKDFEV